MVSLVSRISKFYMLKTTVRVFVFIIRHIEIDITKIEGIKNLHKLVELYAARVACAHHFQVSE